MSSFSISIDQLKRNQYQNYEIGMPRSKIGKKKQLDMKQRQLLKRLKIQNQQMKEQINLLFKKIESLQEQSENSSNSKKTINLNDCHYSQSMSGYAQGKRKSDIKSLDHPDSQSQVMLNQTTQGKITNRSQSYQLEDSFSHAQQMRQDSRLAIQQYSQSQFSQVGSSPRDNQFEVVVEKAIEINEPLAKSKLNQLDLSEIKSQGNDENSFIDNRPTKALQGQEEVEKRETEKRRYQLNQLSCKSESTQLVSEISQITSPHLAPVKETVDREMESSHSIIDIQIRPRQSTFEKQIKQRKKGWWSTFLCCQKED